MPPWTLKVKLVKLEKQEMIQDMVAINWVNPCLNQRSLDFLPRLRNFLENFSSINVQVKNGNLRDWSEKMVLLSLYNLD